MRADWRRALAALIAGGLTPLAFAPFGLWPLAVLTPAALMLLCRGASGWRAFRLGWLFGFGLFGVGVPWVYVSIHEFGGVIAPVAAVITVGFAAVLAVFPALACALARQVGARGAAGFLLAWPAAWGLLEWLRGWFLTGFPWLQLGYSQTDTWLAGWAPVTGVLGVSLLLSFSAGALACAAAESGWRRRFLPLLLLPVLFGAGWALDRVAWTRAEGEPVAAVLLQGNFGQDVKWEREWLAPQLDWYGRATLAAEGADLIVWPETALPAFHDQLEVPYFSSLSSVMQERGAALLAGLLYREDGRPYNAIMGFGAAEGVYRKIHLVPLGEFFPFESLLRFLLPGLDIPLNDLAAGSAEQEPLTALGRVVGASICYEDAFGAVTRRSLPEAGLLVNVSNDAWFGDSAAPHQHLQIARMLARMSGRPMLRAANTGISAIIDHRGAPSATLDQRVQGVLEETVTARAGTTPWIAAGDWPTVIAVVLILIGTQVLSGRRKAVA